MAKKPKSDDFHDTTLPNLEVVRPFRLKGDALQVGDIVRKKDFPNKASMLNLLHMDPERVKETDETPRRSGVKKADEAPTGGSGKIGLPGFMGGGSKFDAEGFDKDGYDKDGYDKDGYDRDGVDRDGYTRD